MKKNNILFITSNMSAGGAQRVISELANNLTKIYKKVVIASIFDASNFYSLDSRIVYEVFEKESSNKIKIQIERISFIRNLVQKYKIDTVISFLADVNIYSCIALINVKVNLIVSERNDPAREPRSIIKQVLRKLVYFRPNGFVFQTEDAQNYFSARIQRKSVIIHNPVKAYLPIRKIDYNPGKMVSIGRLEPQKNYPLAFRAIKRVIQDGYSLEYHIYGEGSLRDTLIKLADELDIRKFVFFEGTSSSVHELIADANIFLLCSDYEGMPNVLMECMAIGLLCISTDCPCGGPRALIRHNKNGILVDTGDEEMLAKTIEIVLDNPEAMKEIANNAREVRKSHSEEVIKSKWDDYISKISMGG